MKKIINTPDAPKPIGPYNQAVMANDTLYISGQIGIDPAAGKMVEGDVVVQAKQVMKNLENILKAAGMDFSNVVKTSIFLKDMHDFPKVNEVYGGCFKSDPPARETVQVGALPLFVDVEISLIAVK
ncbi:MAG: RidA family protein [Bacteroidales bacterium]|jgi:2-iminobutanoate/2-iminopropanoate deaminase|nr:RidA family protein [Bacteroidales bacterium]NLM92367.1 RidA family protein [Bacteroidales bacterium]